MCILWEEPEIKLALSFKYFVFKALINICHPCDMWFCNCKLSHYLNTLYTLIHHFIIRYVVKNMGIVYVQVSL